MMTRPIRPGVTVAAVYRRTRRNRVVRLTPADGPARSRRVGSRVRTRTGPRRAHRRLDSRRRRRSIAGRRRLLLQQDCSPRLFVVQ